MLRIILILRIVFFILFLSTNAYSAGIITGKVVDKITQLPLPGVNVLLLNTTIGVASDLNGEFTLRNVPVGIYQIQLSFVGYETITKTDISVNSARPTSLEIEMLESTILIEGVTVSSDYFENDPTEVISINNFSYEEIRRAPGGFEDVIRALSVLPGVGQASPGRNDLVVRGGAPSENLFLLDGFPIPNINHFGSQGATGGPLSFVNLDFVHETFFSTGGFSALYGDKLSSVLRIDLREGRKDRFGGKAMISASQFGLNLEGPINESSNFLFSIRRSYLDFIFNAAGFNFVPEYYDVISKYSLDINQQNKLSFLFVGAFDNVKFNNNDKEDIFDNSRILGSDQIQYMGGLSFRHLFEKGFWDIRLSRNFVDYDSIQRDTLLNPIFKNKSIESENTLSFDIIRKVGRSAEILAGVAVKNITFETDIIFPNNFVTSFGDTLPITKLNAEKSFLKTAAYLQYSNVWFNKLRVNLGIRYDYFDAINEKNYFSPRVSISYSLGELTNLNYSWGNYNQFPSYIWLVADRQNRDLKAVNVVQNIFGIEHQLNYDLRIKIEAFYKRYSRYPASQLREYLVLANTGAGFGGSTQNYSSLGLEPLLDKGKGYSRGIEFSAQKKSSDSPLYGIMSLTYSQTKFTSPDGKERNGQYDQTWLFSLSAGYVINHKWETALKFRASTGIPYTPFNSDGTQSVNDYLTKRFTPSHSLDIRIDRRWDFTDWSLITYIDIQNVYNQAIRSSIYWDYQKGEAVKNKSIGILPSIGVNLEF